MQFRCNAGQQTARFEDLALFGRVNATLHWRMDDASVLPGDF
jgi:hypothetical protein